MASRFHMIPTTREIYAAIMDKHGACFVPHETISQPDGSPWGDPNQAQMFTSWGFGHHDFPIVAVRNSWEIDPEDRLKRLNERREFWLCVGKESA